MASLTEHMATMVGLITGSKDPASIAAVMQVQQDLIAIQEEDRKLRERIIELENDRLAADSLKFHDNCYWRGEQGPFCSRCFDVEHCLVHMADVSSQEYTDYYIYRCNNCDSRVETKIKLPPES